jgi:hypothetical protein
MIKKYDIRFDWLVLAVLAVLVAVPALSHDLFRSITTSADPDIVHIYQVLLISDGQAQRMFDHTGYTYFLMLTGWFKFLHFFGWVPVIKISELPDPAKFEPAYQALIYGGRVFSIILATLCVVIFYFIAKKLTHFKYVSAGAAVIFALLPGLSVHAFQMRTELPAIFFMLLALLTLLTASQSHRWHEFYFLTLAVCFAFLATMSKLQIIPLMLALPVIMLVLRSGLDNVKEPAYLTYTWPRVLVVSLFALVISISPLVMAWSQIYPALPERHDVGNHGYQLLIMGYIASIILIYCKFDRRTLPEIILAFCAVSSGFAIAFYVNFLHHQIANTANLVNFVEHMTVYATANTGVSFGRIESSLLFGELLEKVLSNIGRVFNNNFLRFSPTTSTLTPMVWMVALGIALSAYFKNWRTALIALALMLTGFGMEIFSGIRSFADHYRIFTEPMILLAALVLFDKLLNSQKFIELRNQNVARFASMILIGAFGLFTVTGSLIYSFSDKVWNTRIDGCNQTKGYMPKLTNHFCSKKFLDGDK